MQPRKLWRNASTGSGSHEQCRRSCFAEPQLQSPSKVCGWTRARQGSAPEGELEAVKWLWRHEIVACEYIHSKVGGQKKAGWYMMAGHSIPTSWTILPQIQLLARYEQYDADLDIGDNKLDRITVGTNLFVDSKYTKIQLNYQINNEQGTSVSNNEFVGRFQVVF